MHLSDVREAMVHRQDPPVVRPAAVRLVTAAQVMVERAVAARVEAVRAAAIPVEETAASARAAVAATAREMRARARSEID
jgi:hypothetical protein